jgi:hypothetical protein
MKCKLHAQPIIAVVALALGLSSLMGIIVVPSSTQLAARNNNNELPTPGSPSASALPTKPTSSHPLCQTGSYGVRITISVCQEYNKLLFHDIINTNVFHFTLSLLIRTSLGHY